MLFGSWSSASLRSATPNCSSLCTRCSWLVLWSIDFHWWTTVQSGFEAIRRRIRNSRPSKLLPDPVPENSIFIGHWRTNENRGSRPLGSLSEPYRRPIPYWRVPDHSWGQNTFSWSDVLLTFTNKYRLPSNHSHSRQMYPGFKFPVLKYPWHRRQLSQWVSFPAMFFWPGYRQTDKQTYFIS